MCVQDGISAAPDTVSEAPLLAYVQPLLKYTESEYSAKVRQNAALTRKGWMYFT